MNISITVLGDKTGDVDVLTDFALPFFRIPRFLVPPSGSRCIMWLGSRFSDIENSDFQYDQRLAWWVEGVRTLFQGCANKVLRIWWQHKHTDSIGNFLALSCTSQTIICACKVLFYGHTKTYMIYIIMHYLQYIHLSLYLSIYQSIYQSIYSYAVLSIYPCSHPPSQPPFQPRTNLSNPPTYLIHIT